MVELSVVIVNYKVPYYLLQCLDAVKKASSLIRCEVIVVDNASDDNSQVLVEKYFPTVIYVANEKNEGFAKANNKAIAMAKAPYVLLLNPDTIIAEDALQNVCHFAKNMPQFGALGVRMIDASGRFLPESKRSLPTVWNAICKFLHLPLSGKNSYYYTQLGDKQVGEVPILSGAFMLLHKAALGDVAYLDERYFMYGEDIDISYAITLSGYKNYYLPCTMLHYKGESTRYDARYMRNFYGAMQLFYQKYNGKGVVYFLLKILTKIMVLLASLRSTPQKLDDKREVVTLSTVQYTYAQIIEFMEQNQGACRVQIEHPTMGFVV